MAIVGLLVGQCGNQLGTSFYDGLFHDSYSKSNDSRLRERWFHYADNDRIEARSILVDTELKVIETETRKRRPWSYPGRRSVTADHGGSANNWSLGYGVYGPEFLDRVENALQSETEKCDELEGLLAVFSSSGGTGSGIGSYLCEHLKDLFPKKILVNSLVLPFSKGEVTVQNYNSLFTVSKLAGCSDGVLLFSNDYVHKMCSNVLKIENISVDDINEFIADQLVVALNTDLETNTLTQVIPYLASHPHYKLLNVRGSPYCSVKSHRYESAVSWGSILLHLKTMLLHANDWSYDFKPTSKFISNASSKHEPRAGSCKSLGLFSASRGTAPDLKNPLRTLNVDCLYPAWIPTSERFHESHRNSKLKARDKSCVVVANNGFYTDCLKSALDKAWALFSNNAFVHHYTRNGIKEMDFVEAFTNVQHIVNCYDKLN